MTRFQGQIMDLDGFMGMSATRGSFYLVVLCFVIIAIYGFFGARLKRKADPSRIIKGEGYTV